MFVSCKPTISEWYIICMYQKQGDSMPSSYYDIASTLRERITSGFYSASNPIPSERMLEQEFNAHRATIRRAMNLLTDEGLLQRSPGRRAYPVLEKPRSTGNIGLFVSDPSDLNTRSLVANGCSEVLLEHNEKSGLIWSHYKPFELGADPSEGAELHLEELMGLILWPPDFINTELLRRVQKKMPAVIIDTRVPGIDVDFVGFADVEAGYEAAKHLYQVGHRRIGFVGNLVPETVRHRWHGVSIFCREYGIELCWEWAAFGINLSTVPELMKLALVSIPRRDWPTALVCSNDNLAADLMASLAPMGIRVPDDLALIGFSNSQPALLGALGLTTLAQPYEQMGREAMTLLLDRQSKWHQRLPTQEIRLPMKLIVRTSCGASASNRTADSSS